MVAANAQSRKYRSESGFKVGHGLVIGGVSFTIGGFLTTPDYTYQSTGPYKVVYVRKPFFQQGARMMAITTGVTLTVSGLITLIADR